MVNIDPNLEILEGMYGKRDDVTSNTVQRSKHLQYWRKCQGCQIHTNDLGWIILGPAMSPYTATEYYEFQRGKHAEPLPQYGSYMAGHSSGSKYDVVEANRRFEPLIELNGIKEIPLDQMIAYNWHRIPVIVKYVPELANIQEYKCTYGCAPLTSTFTDPRHLQTHMKVWHQDVAQPAAIGQEISKAIEAVSSANQISPEAIAAIVMAVREALKAEQPKVG